MCGPGYAVELRDVTFWYGSPAGRVPVLEGIDLRVDWDEFMGLVGPNGGGKTTLLRIILGLLRPQQGTVRVFGRQPREVRHLIGYVPQHARIDLAMPATVLDVVLTGRLYRRRWGWNYRREDYQAAYRALELVQLADLAARPAQCLSGGQRQRVLIARALAAEAKLLLLDEPTAGVDAPTEQSFTDLLHRLNREVPIILATHDIAFVCTHLKTVACLNRRLTVHRASELTPADLARVYGDSKCAIIHQPGCPLFDRGCTLGCLPADRSWQIRPQP
jgi:zinc transport system ATP-binding protein